MWRFDGVKASVASSHDPVTGVADQGDTNIPPRLSQVCCYKGVTRCHRRKDRRNLSYPLIERVCHRPVTGSVTAPCRRPCHRLSRWWERVWKFYSSLYRSPIEFDGEKTLPGPLSQLVTGVSQHSCFA